MIKQLRQYFLKQWGAVDKEKYQALLAELEDTRNSRDQYFDEAEVIRIGANKCLEALNRGEKAFVFNVPVVKYKPHHSLKQHRVKGRFA